MKQLSIMDRIGGGHSAHLICPEDIKQLAQDLQQNASMITAQHIKGRNHDLIEIKVLFHPGTAVQK